MNGNERVTLFFDDFTSSSLDRSVWNVRATEVPYNREQQAYVDSEETIRLVQDGMGKGVNGALAIHGLYRPGSVSAGGGRFDFISGRIDTRTKVEFAPGTISARIKLAEGQGIWPALWALGTSGGWPGAGEIDVMENVG